MRHRASDPVLLACLGLALLSTGLLAVAHLRPDPQLQELQRGMEALRDRLDEATTGGEAGDEAIARLETRIDALREELLEQSMAEQVERLIAGLDDPQDRCIAITRWLAAELRNVSTFHPAGGGRRDLLGRWAIRMGTCGHRSQMMVRMLDMAGIHARVWNMYNFGGRPGAGHSTVQAWYDGGWHFFDPHYGGCFIRDGRVLSWDEVKAAGDEAADLLVTFPNRVDRGRNGHLDDPTLWTPVEGAWADRAYRIENIRATRSVGFFQEPTPKTLYPRVDASVLEDGPIVVGAVDDDWADVRREGVTLGLSERMSVLGTFQDFFRFTYEFEHAEPGVRYRIELVPARLRDAGPGSFRATTDGARLVEGATLPGRAAPEGRYEGEPWRIVVVAEGPAFTVSLDHDLDTLDRGLLVDRIEIARVR